LWAYKKTLGGIGSSFCRGFGPYQRTFAQIEKKRQGAGDAHGQQSQDRQPELPYPEPAPFRANESNEDHGRNQYIQSKEAADAIREKLPEDQAEVQPVFQDPRDELRVGENDSEYAKEQIDILSLHRTSPFGLPADEAILRKIPPRLLRRSKTPHAPGKLAYMRNCGK